MAIVELVPDRDPVVLPSAKLMVVHVVRQFYPNRGGLEDFVANLARQQIAAGMGVRVLTCDRLFTALDRRLPAREMLDGIEIVRLPFRGSTRYPLTPSVLRHLAGADIVHVHGIDFFFDYLALTRPLHRKPLVATTHGGFFHTAAHGMLKRLWFGSITRASATAYGRIVACSHADARQFTGIARRLDTVENGVDVDKFASRASPVPVKRLVSLGRFSTNKHPERLVAAMAVLARHDPSWRLDLVGTESDWSAERLRALVAEAGLDEAVALHVGLPTAEVADLVGRASLFVSASTFEGFGIALIEAASAGLKTVVHSNAAFADLAARQPGITLADFGDAERAAEAIETAYTELLLAGRPRTDWTRAFSWPDVATRYAAVYAGVLADEG